MTTAPTTICDPTPHPTPDSGPARRRDGDSANRRPRPVAGSATGASIAAGAVVLICVLARFPGHLLTVSGLRGWVPSLIAVMAVVNGVRALAQAPFTFARRKASVARWAADALTTLGGAIVVGAALTIPLYALIRASSWWWLWAWAMFSAVTVAGQVAMPIVMRIQCGPLAPAGAPLAARVRAIGARVGVDIGRSDADGDTGGSVMIAGKSTGKGPRCNAYVVGLGPTRRVVLESGLAAWPPAMIDQVVAHELGHWRLGHTARRLPITVLVQLATFALAAATLSWPQLLHWAGVATAGDPGSYPLLLALTAVLVLPARLLLAGYDRAQERAADRFALSVLADPSEFAAMLDLAARDGGAPRHLPWWRQITAGHPPVDQRILACQAYAPAVPGERGFRS